MLNTLTARGEAGSARRSLRTELLFNLASLAAAALFLGLWTASILRLTVFSFPYTVALLVLLVVVDVLIFVALGNYLVERLVLRPLADTTAVAEAIAGGDYDRRAQGGQTQEIAVLSAALNRLTDQLLQNQEKLAENVRSLDEANQLLHETQRELLQAEKMASIGRLAAGVAHEIGNPLGAVLGYVSVMKRRGGEVDLVEGVEREARRIDQIVRGLLDYARPGPSRREPVDVDGSIRRVADLLESQGRLTGIDLRLDLGNGLPPIAAVPHRIDQMFVNLFTNAIAAMNGSGRLTVVTRLELYSPERPLPARRSDDPPGVDYSHLRRQRHATSRDRGALGPGREVVHVVVADSGPGIRPELMDSIFDPFFTTKAPGEGTGLGLAIVASTVAEVGGRIDVTSAEGGGATFHLFLPLAEPDE